MRVCVHSWTEESLLATFSAVAMLSGSQFKEFSPLQMEDESGEGDTHRDTHKPTNPQTHTHTHTHTVLGRIFICFFALPPKSVNLVSDLSVWWKGAELKCFRRRERGTCVSPETPNQPRTGCLSPLSGENSSRLRGPGFLRINNIFFRLRVVQDSLSVTVIPAGFFFFFFIPDALDPCFSNSVYLLILFCFLFTSCLLH